MRCGNSAHTSSYPNGGGIKHRFMTQEEKWLAKYNEVVVFIETNHRNPSKHDAEERGKYLNWIKHNKKLYNAGVLNPDRVEKFKELLELSEKYKHVNQYQ